jgi:endonuclease YncB( thermonuclease family)
LRDYCLVAVLIVLAIGQMRGEPEVLDKIFGRQISTPAYAAAPAQKAYGTIKNERKPTEAKATIVANGNIICHKPFVIDGDTMDCNGLRIRLAGIDAPEMPNHCRPGRKCTPGNPFAAKKHLESLLREDVVCSPVEIDDYGRTIARCASKGKDLSCAMIRAKHAVMRYRSLAC